MVKFKYLLLFLILSVTGCTEESSVRKPIEQSIADIGNLEVMHFNVKIMGRNKPEDQWYKKGHRILIYSANANITGFVNLQDIGSDDISYPNPADNKTFVLTIPHLTKNNLFLEIHERDIRQEFMRVGTLRSRFKQDEMEGIKKSIQDTLESRILELGLIKETEDAAKEALQIFCSNLNYNVTVRFDDKE